MAYGDIYPKTPVQGFTKTYVHGATKSCCEQGCQAPGLAELAQNLADEAHELRESIIRKVVEMQPTRALWCEQGGHSFSEKDPDLQVLTIQGRGPGGETVEESRTSCGECAALAKTRLGKAHQQAIKPAVVE